MIIKNIKARTIALPLKHNLLHSGGEHPGRFILTIVEIETNEGEIGYGETGGGGFSLAPFIEKLKYQLIGEDPYNIRRLRWKIASPITSTYYNQLLPQLWFPLETALLDIKGKTLGVPINDLLGGSVRDSIDVSAYIFPTPDTIEIDDMAKMTESIVREGGFKVVKIKAGVFSLEHEIDEIKAIAKRIPQIKFRIDPNGAWNLSEAINFSKALSEINIEYFEDPVWTMEGLRYFKEATGRVVATNTVATRFEDLSNVFHRRAVDIVLGDPHWWFGLYGFLELSASIWSLGLELGMHSPGESGIALAAMLHAASSSPNLGYAIDTHYIHLKDDIIKDPFSINEGKLRVPKEPGLGIRIDENKVQKYEELYKEEGEYTYHTSESRNYNWIPTIPRRIFLKCNCHNFK